MADKHGVLIDVGFSSDVKGYIDQLEKDFKKVDFSEVIGISEAFDKQIEDAKDKIQELKKEIEKIAQGRVIDEDLQKEFAALNKSVKELQEGFKLLVQATPKSKQTSLTGQLAKINAGLKETAEVTKNTTTALRELDNRELLNKDKLSTLAALYHDLERARQAAEKFDKTTKKIGNTPYNDADEVLNDIKAQYNLYLELDNKMQDLQDKDKLSKGDELKITKLNGQILESITNINRLITTIATMDQKWGEMTIEDDGIKTNLTNINQETSGLLEDLLQQVANSKAKLQQEFSALGGQGNLSDMFIQSTNKKERITLPVVVAPGSKEKILKQCIELTDSISQELVEHPIQVEVQLLTAYQSSKNTALIKELQKNIITMQESATNAINNGLSESEAAQFTQISSDMTKLLERLNTQIDNAMLFNVQVQTESAREAIRGFVADVKEKLKEVAKNPPSIKPGLELSKQAKRQFKSEINAFIKEANKEINKLQASKVKFTDDVFSVYIKQLQEAIQELKKLKDIINNKDMIQELSKASKDANTEAIEELKKQIATDIQTLYSELKTTFDPKKNNLALWSNKLLSTLDEAKNKLNTLFSFSGNKNVLSEYLDDIAYSDKLKQNIEGNMSTLEHGGVLLKSGKVIGLTSTDQHGSTRYSNPKVHEQYKQEDVLSTIHTHSGDFKWMPSLADLSNAMNRDIEYAITSTANEVVTFNVKKFKEQFGANSKKLNTLHAASEKYTETDLLKEVSEIYKEIIPTILSNAKSTIKNLRKNSPINNSKMTNEEWLTNAFNMVTTRSSEKAFWPSLITNLGLGNDKNWESTFSKLTNNAFHLVHQENNKNDFYSRSAFINVVQRKFIEAFAKNKINFDDFFKIQSHEDFSKNLPFDLAMQMGEPQKDLSDVATTINDIVNNINKLGEVNISKDVNFGDMEQVIIDIKNNLAEILNILKQFPDTIGNLSLTPFDNDLQKLKKELDNLKSSGANKTEISKVTKEINSLEKKRKAYIEGLIKNTQGESQKTSTKKDDLLNNARQNLNKNFENIQTGFTDMLQKDNRTLIESTFEPTKDGLIKIKALIKEADDSYKSLIYTTKTGKGKNPFTLVEAKEGFSVDKQAATYERWKKIQEELKDPKMIGNIEPNTKAWDELVKLAEDFGLKMQDIDKIVRNVDHGIESFQFFDKGGNRTTLGINSDYVLYEKNPIIQISQDVDAFKKKIATLPKILQDSITKYDANASSKYIDTLKDIANLWEKIQQYQKMGNISAEDFTNLNNLFGGSSETVENILSARLPIEGRTDEIIKNVNNIKQEFKSLFELIQSGDYNTTPDIEDRLKKVANDAMQVYQSINLDSSKVAKSTSIDKLLRNIGDELTKNTKMSSNFKAELNQLVKEIQEMGYAMPNKKLKEFQTRFQSVVSKIHLAGQTGKGFFDQMGQSLGRSVISFANMYLSLYRLVGYLKQGVTEVTNLDKALTTMSYTMDVNDAQIKQMSKDIVNMAKDLSISVDNVSQIYQIYANMQTTAEEMMETAKPTAILANLSGVDASTAADQIQGVLNQFGMLADQSEHIIDVYDYISSNISVDYSKGIAGMSDAVKNVGNIAYEAGLSFEQLSAIIAKVMEKTRQDGSAIGNALRTNNIVPTYRNMRNVNTSKTSKS